VGADDRGSHDGEGGLTLEQMFDYAALIGAGNAHSVVGTARLDG
jgi:hypothetical protein